MPKILEKNLMGAEFARQSFRATPPAGTHLDDMLDPEYWAHVARKFTPYDVIEVVPEDGAFYARLLVINVGKLWAKVYKLEYADLAKKVKKESGNLGNFEAKFFGPVAKWKAINKTNGSLLSQESFQTREDAESYIEQYKKEIAA